MVDDRSERCESLALDDIERHSRPETTASAGDALLGAPASFRIERTLDRLFPAGEFASLVEWLVDRAPRRGQSQVAAGVLRWENASDVEHLIVMVTPGPKSTHLRLEARYGSLAAFVYFAAFFTGMFLVAAFGGFVLGIRTLGGALTLAPAGLLVSYLAGRLFWSRLIRQRQREFAALVEELAERMKGENAD